MSKIILLIVGVIAGVVLLFNIGPLILLAVCAWVGYMIFKQFMQTDSTSAKIMWVVLGLVVLTIGLSNFYSVIGIAAGIILYLVVKRWNGQDKPLYENNNNDPFVHFEDQWADMNK